MGIGMIVVGLLAAVGVVVPAVLSKRKDRELAGIADDH